MSSRTLVGSQHTIYPLINCSTKLHAAVTPVKIRFSYITVNIIGQTAAAKTTTKTPCIKDNIKHKMVNIIEITNCLVRTDIDLLIYVTQLINKIIPLHKDGTAIYFSKNTGMEQSIFPI